MTNHTPVFTSSSASGSFTEFANTTDSTALHQLSGTMSFKDSDQGDTHTTSATLHSATLSSGSIIPAASLAHFQTAMSSQITSDHNGSGSLKWMFSDADDDFDFLSKNQTLVLTYDITVSDNHGGTAIQTVKVTVTGTDDKPVINMTTVATVTEQAGQTLSLSPDTVHVALNFTDDDLTNTGHTATVIAASASGTTSGLLPGSLGTDELMSFYNVDNVVKTSGSSAGTINTTFAAPDLAFDYLAAGQHLDITYTVQLDDHAGGISTQTVTVTVVGTNDKPVFLSPPEFAHLVEDHNVTPAGNLAAHGDLVFGDVDLSDTHTVSTTVSATRSGGGTIPLDNTALLAAFATSLSPDSTGHLLGDISWNFMLPNAETNFLSGGETLTLVYHVAVHDPFGGIDTQDVTVTILGVNHPVVITSGPESSTVSELANTTGSAATDTTPTTPAGTLAFTDADTSDTHTVAVTLDATSGATVPAATQADLASALTTVLHDSTGSGSGSIDWNFAIADHDLDYLAAGETLTVNYDIKVSDGSTSSTQTVSVVITGSNDPVTITSGPGSASLAEQPGVTDSSAIDTTTPVPTGTLAFTDVDLSDTHAVSVALDSATWSVDPNFLPADTFADLQTALATTLHDSTGTGHGGIDWTFSIPDRDLDFLSPGETLTVTYDVTVADGSTSSTQTVTVTIDGASDPLVVTPASVDVSDSAGTDAGNLIAAGTVADLQHAVDISTPRTITAVDGSAGNVGHAVAGTYGSLELDADGTYTYVANSAVDALQVGDHVTDQFNFTVDDGQGHQATTTLTFNVAGADDNPVITGGNISGAVTEDAGPPAIVNGDFETGNLSGWTTTGSHIDVQQLELGGSFGHYSVELSPTSIPETLAQDVATTPGQNYFISFDLIGDPEGTHTPFSVTWDGATLLSLTDVPAGVNHYAFEVAGDGVASSTSLQFSYADDADGMILDSVSVSPATSPPTESTSGAISFADADSGDTHTASFAPLDSGYVGTFTLDPVTEASGTGSIGWHYTVNNADIQFLAQGQTLTQDYLVTVADAHGGSVVQDIAVTLVGTNDAPTAVGENVVTDVDANGTVDIPTWALAANDTDPDLTDHLFVNGVTSSAGGSATLSGSDVLFSDDATPGGSFNYTSSDGIATSNQATATVINNTASATTLTGTGGDDILIATNGTEALNGGAGNDILIGNAGSHTMTGGGGNDTFAFQHSSDGPGIITDFNNTTEHDHIAVSASGFGGGLSAGMDVSSLFETSGDNQFSGSGAEFHFDTANETLYFSADGTQASAIAVTSVQAGVVLNPHDLLVV